MLAVAIARQRLARNLTSSQFSALSSQLRHVGARTTPGRKSSGAAEGRKEIDLEALREKIARHVSRKSLAMVRTTTEVVKVGNLAALKYLFELIGVYPSGGASAVEEDSDDLARTLLNRLDLRNEKMESMRAWGFRPRRRRIR